MEHQGYGGIHMRRIKIVITLLLVLVLCVLEISSGISTEVYAKQAENILEDQAYVGDFNLHEYRADVYLKEDTVCNRIIQNMLTTTFPSQLVVDQLDSKAAFQNSVKAWKAAHFVTSPSKIAEGGMDEQGYYTAIILSIFKAETSHDTYMYDCIKEVNSDTNKILSNMKKWVKEADEIELEAVSKNQILTTISISDQSKIRTYLSKVFKENHPVLNHSSTITSDLETIFDSVSTLGEAIELMESYIQIAEMADNMKTVLLEMYEQCPYSNQAMKAALYEVAMSSKNLTGAISATIVNTAGKEAENVLGILIDEGWEKIIKSSPYARAFMTGAEVGTWLGDTVCSTLFSTDKTIEQYEKMKCLSEFTKLLRGTVTSIGNTYLSNKSTEHADNYFAAVDALFSAGYLSCDFAADYGKILYEDAALGWVSINKESYEEYMKSVKAMKGYYGNDEESLVNNYLAELECDYPEIYEILMGVNDSDKVPVSRIENSTKTTKISNKSVTIFPGETVSLKILGTSKKASWSSSNKSVVKVNASGKITGVKKGKASVKAKIDKKTYVCKVKVSKQSKKSALKYYRSILDELYYNVMNRSFSYDDGSQYFSNMGYVFRDVNGDGSYELLIGSADKADSMFFKMYSIVNGKAKLIAQTSGWYWYHLCKKNRIKEEVSSQSVNYCTLKHGKLKHGKSIKQPFYEDSRYPTININYTSFQMYKPSK